MTTAQDPATFCEAFQRTASIDPEAVALRTPGGAQVLTWRELAAQVRKVAAGLAGLGVRRGDTVSLMMANRIEFYPFEIGAQHLGATSFSVYNTLPAEQLTYLFDNAGTKVAICEEQYVDRIRASGAPIEHLVCIDGSPPGTISVDDLYAAAQTDFDFDATWRAVRPEDVITLIYTSGTTGNPKGVEMTHASLLFEAYGLDAVLGSRFGDRTTSYLPSAHIADRMMALYPLEVFGTCRCGGAAGRAAHGVGGRAASVGEAQSRNRIRCRQRNRRGKATGVAVGDVGGRPARRRSGGRWRDLGGAGCRMGPSR
jgi:long-subunit acyl-CoA synthetase (AMP-forming)